MTDYVNQTRGRGEPLPVVANPPTDSRRWLFLKIDHLQFQDGLTFSESIAPNFEVAPSSQNSRRSISGCRQLVKVRLEFWDAAIFPKSAAFDCEISGSSPDWWPSISTWHVLQHALQQEIAHAWPPACTPAQGSCTHVLRHTTQHQAHARMFSRVHASTSLMHACPPDQIARRNTRSRSAGLTPLSHSRNSRGVVRHSTLTLARFRSFDQIGNPPVAHFTLVQHRR